MFALAGLAAAAVAVVLFYRFPAAELLTARATALPPIAAETTTTTGPRLYRTGGATPDDRIGLVVVMTPNVVEALAREAWEMAWAFYGVWPVIAALVGGVVLVRDARKPAGGTYPGSHEWDAALTIGVWLAVVMVLLVVGVVARLYVRYPLFALPAVSLGAGMALAALSRRGRWGQVAVAALLLFSAASSLLLWYDRIVYAFKPVV